MVMQRRAQVMKAVEELVAHINRCEMKDERVSAAEHRLA